jgi:hypothetical protein
MSLINDALKKAQNRHGESTPPTPGPAGPASIPAAPRKGKSPLGKVILIGSGIALLSAAVSTAVILVVIRKDPPPPAPVVGPAPAETSAPISPAPAVLSPIKPSEAPAPSPVAPATGTPVQPPPIITAAPTPPSPVVFPPAAEPAPTIKLGTRIQSFIDRLRITSIRISDTGNKAILNDRLFRVNDLVEPSLGLRLTEIKPSQLTFTDEVGNTYLRHF